MTEFAGVQTLFPATSLPPVPLPLPRAAAVAPRGLALRTTAGDLDYKQLHAMADLMARRLVSLGVQVGAGDRIAALLPNGAEFVTLIHAAGRLGAILVPLNTRLSERELQCQLQNTTPRILVTDRAAAVRLPPGSLPVTVVGDPDVLPDRSSEADGSHRRYLANTHPADVILLETAEQGVPQAIVHSSGTTGAPKGVVITWANQCWSAAGSALRLGSSPSDRWLAVLPLFHVGGLAIVLRCAWQCSTVVVHARFDAAAVRRSLADDEITVVSLVPTMLRRLLDGAGANPGANPDASDVGRSARSTATSRAAAVPLADRSLPDDSAPPAGLRAVLLGGGGASAALLWRAAEAGWPLAPTYGLTEATSQVATCAPPWRPDGDDPPAAPPMPFTAVRVMIDDLASRRVAAVGETGVVEVRGPTVCAGYWRDRLATSNAIDDDGWLRTGDGGMLDDAGRLSVLGRRVDLIVSGGENVYPAEVEAVLCSHPAVADACVVGIPDEEWGELVVAAVVPRPGATIDLEGLLATARNSLAGFKVPRRVRVVNGLPRTASGKVRRGQVRRLWLAGEEIGRPGLHPANETTDKDEQ